MDMTIEQTAEFLHLKPSTVRTYIRTDPTFPVRGTGSDSRVHRGALEGWLRSRYTPEAREMLGGDRGMLLDEILNYAVPVVPACGVYVLVLGKEVVYVGQSISVFSRLGSHMRDRRFDSYYVFPCEPEELDAKEAYMIRLFKPVYNTVYPNA